jgi:hypothetical protein
MHRADVAQRFFILAGLIRHEYWLHGQKAEDYAFEADPDKLTLRATNQRDQNRHCEVTVTEEMLDNDLYALARKFYKDLCGGQSELARGLGQSRTRRRA